MASTNPARGMRDFLPADVRKRNYVIGIIKQVYESYGFEPLETPSVENLETLMGKYGDEGNQLVFKILKRGEKLDLANASKESDLSDLALRYDLTVPLARVVANNKNDLPKFFKRYQIQPVWRADRPAKGRFREFYQCDVDCIGSTSMVVEAEIISAACDILTKLGFNDFVVRLNHREILMKLFSTYANPDQRMAAIGAIDKLDKIGKSGVLDELTSIGLNPSDADMLVSFMTNSESAEHPPVAFNVLEGFISSNVNGLDDLKRISEFCEDSAPIKIDYSLARGLSYYTGAIMEIALTDGDFKGSIGGGGRYDGLIGMFGKEQIPACGFSLGLERILVVMEERGMFPPEIAESTPADVLVTIFSEETIADSLKLANELRANGLRVTVYPQADKEDKQWKYANAIKVPWICTVNATDIADGMVAFQNLVTRERFREPFADAAAKIAG